MDLLDDWKDHPKGCKAEHGWADGYDGPCTDDSWDIVNALLNIDPRFESDKIDRLEKLARRLGATEDDIRAVETERQFQERFHQLPKPVGERFPKVDPAPYIAELDQYRRWELNLPDPGVPLCPAQVTAEASEDIRKYHTRVLGVTTCTLPATHTRGYHHAAEVLHKGIILEEGRQWWSEFCWYAPARGLGQVWKR